jgi:hypothetical protein
VDSLGEIIGQGDEDPNSFYRAFRSWEGKTPVEWCFSASEGQCRSTLGFVSCNNFVTLPNSLASSAPLATNLWYISWATKEAMRILRIGTYKRSNAG